LALVPPTIPKVGTTMSAAPLTPPAPAATLQGSAAAAAQTAKSMMPAPAVLPATPTAPVVAAPQVQANAAVAPAQENPQAEVQSDVAMESAPAAGSGGGQFAWPVQGKVIGAFGTMKDGTKNDGVNIAAPAGAPVVAAADGVVAYAGNELRGFGNMILIRHDGGYVTAYAHNASLLVKKGDKVKRGQTIARVGATGAVFGPQLHFEIRKGTEPVDPMTFLGG
jgi:murein DD-endopeptidase MepM/ murein hydrolase activator NlpD